MTSERICPACGRPMMLVVGGAWFECENKQCDYTEDNDMEVTDEDSARQ